MPKEIQIENESCRLAVDPAGNFLRLTDLRTRTEWRCGQIFRMEYDEGIFLGPRHCRMQMKKSGAAISIRLDRFRFLARWPGNPYCRPENGPSLVVHLRIALEGELIRFAVDAIENLDDESLKVCFPLGLGVFNSRQQGQLVLPYACGMLLSFPRQDTVAWDHRIYDYGVNMPIYGILRGKTGLACIVETPFDCRLKTSVNESCSTDASVSPIQVFSKRQNKPRAALYRVIPQATHVSIAKWYRQWLIDKGRWVSLAEKIDRNPEVEQLVGAVVWKHNVYCRRRPAGVKKDYSLYVLNPKQSEMEGKPGNWTAREVFNTAKARGFDRVMVYNTGWNRGGYDSMYPTRLPPHPSRGTPADFQKTAQWARSLSPGYIFSVHDNYSEAYKNSPEWSERYIIKGEHGECLHGGIWRGGRSYQMCPQEALRFAKRDLPKVAGLLGRGSIYIDVLGCVQLHECFDPKHPISREMDAKWRCDIFEEAKKHLGSLTTEGTPSDYLCGVVDLGAFFYVHSFLPPVAAPQPVPVPLFQLVYHDSVLNYASESYTRFYGSEYLLYVALYNFLPFSLEEISLRLSKEVRDCYRSEMVDHEFLSSASVDRMTDGCFQTHGVQRTRFANGMSLVANFGGKACRIGKTTIRPRDFAVVREEV
ncbi:MAG: DUF5696 domain-containing protein [Verrucomicrobiae bacterium]|nr:DUF5696 domain-containing protein [Verrucomicrobiae bacterium]